MGTALYFTEDTSVIDFQNIQVTVRDCNFTGLGSYDGAVVYVDGQGFEITISDSVFDQNVGVAGPADLLVVSFLSFEVQNTTFSNFETGDTAQALSMEFSLSGDFTYVPVLDNITFQ